MIRCIRTALGAAVVFWLAPVAGHAQSSPNEAGPAGAKIEAADVEALRALDRLFSDHPKIVEAYLLERARPSYRLEAVIASLRIPTFQAALLDGPGFGPENGRVIVEFADYNCGACKNTAPVFREFVKKHDLRVIVHESPIFGQDSEDAAKVALAAARQGRYEEFHFAMMALDRRATKQSALSVAEELGLDMARLRSDMASAAVAEQMERDQTLHRTINVRPSTPNFIVDTTLVSGWSEIAVADALGVGEDTADGR